MRRPALNSDSRARCHSLVRMRRDAGSRGGGRRATVRAKFILISMAVLVTAACSSSPSSGPPTCSPGELKFTGSLSGMPQSHAGKIDMNGFHTVSGGNRSDVSVTSGGTSLDLEWDGRPSAEAAVATTGTLYLSRDGGPADMHVSGSGSKVTLQRRCELVGYLFVDVVLEERRCRGRRARGLLVAVSAAQSAPTRSTKTGSAGAI